MPNSFVDFVIEYPAFYEGSGAVEFKYYKDAVPSKDETTSNLSVFSLLIDE